MWLFAYFIYKFPSLVVDLDFKAPMSTRYLVQKLSDSRSLFALGRFCFGPFWKIVNQDDDMTIPIDLWKVTDVHSNLFHHNGWYWYRLQIYLWRFLNLTYLLISAAILCQKNLCAILSYVVFFPLCETMECSESPVPRRPSLIISIWLSLSLTTNLFLQNKWPSLTL